MRETDGEVERGKEEDGGGVIKCRDGSQGSL